MKYRKISMSTVHYLMRRVKKARGLVRVRWDIDKQTRYLEPFDVREIVRYFEPQEHREKVSISHGADDARTKHHIRLELVVDCLFEKEEGSSLGFLDLRFSL